jgi:hypothetical protein
MSQIYKGATAGSLPSEVTEIIQADSGNQATASAHIIIINSDDSTTNNANGITTLAGVTDSLLGNQVKILLTNRLQGTATSTNASNADIITFALDGAASKVYRASFEVAGKSTAGGFVVEGVGYTVNASFSTDGASASIIGTPYSDTDEDTNLTGCTISVVASGNNIILRAVGIALKTIQYSAVGHYVVI